MPATRGEQTVQKPELVTKAACVLHALCLYLALFSVIFPIQNTPALASAPTATQGMCDQVAHQAARESGVPLSVMQAITRTETGRVQGGRLTPWPWTVNMEGAGHWFDSRAEAEAYVTKHHARGARSYDVGCFQINYRWHGQHFASPTAMFDPLSNARYAARFLSELYAETGNWSKAAGAYHSRTPEYATRYRIRFDRIRSKLDGGPEASPPRLAATQTPSQPIPIQTPRVNRYPLLQPGAQSSGLGSLVPGTTSRAALISLGGGTQP